MNPKMQNRLAVQADRRSRFLEMARGRFIPPTSLQDAQKRWDELVLLKKDLECQATSVNQQVRLRLPERYSHWRGEVKVLLLHLEAELSLLKTWIREENVRLHPVGGPVRPGCARDDARWRLSLVRATLRGGIKAQRGEDPTTCRRCGAVGTWIQCPVCLDGQRDPWAILRQLNRASFGSQEDLEQLEADFSRQAASIGQAG